MPAQATERIRTSRAVVVLRPGVRRIRTIRIDVNGVPVDVHRVLAVGVATVFVIAVIVVVVIRVVVAIATVVTPL